MSKEIELRHQDFSEEDLIRLVRESQEGYIEVGRKPAARQMFFNHANLKNPRRDVIFYWRSLYVLCEDEYEFAIKAVGDWNLWQNIKRNCNELVKVLLPQWEDERERRQLSSAYENVMEDVRSGDVKSSQWMIQHLTKFKGKPTKNEKSKKKEQVSSALDTVLNDIEENYSQLN